MAAKSTAFLGRASRAPTTSTRRDGGTALSATDPILQAGTMAGAIFGGFTRWHYNNILGDRNGENRIFSLPVGVRIARDVTFAPMCIVLWRRAILFFTPDSNPPPGFFSMYRDDLGVDYILMGEPPEAGDEIQLPVAILELAA